MGYFSGVVRLPGTVNPPGMKFFYLSSRQAPLGSHGAPRELPGTKLSYLSSRQATPGSSLPSMNSRLAPPPVEMWVILSA